MFRPKNTLLFFAVAVAAVLVVPALFRDGMFADGILYAAVSRNLANGSGTFWDLHFTKYMHDHFHEQPPLVFFLQSLFFRLFGNTIYPERIYDLVFALIDGWLIVKMWRNVFSGEQEYRDAGALPLFLFFFSPVVFWAFTNNVIEITMAAFALASIDAQFSALVRKKNVAVNLLLAFVWLICSSMSKGPQGLFPLVFPAILWLTMKKNVSLKKAVLACTAFAAAAAVFYFALLQFGSVRSAYASWYNNRILTTFRGTNNTTGSHFRMLYDLFLDLLPLLGLAVVLFLAGRKKILPGKHNAFAAGHLFLLTALSASLPLLVTREQRPFYLTTSMPFYALAIACYTAPFFVALVNGIAAKKRFWKISGIVSLVIIAGAIAVTFVFAGTPKRDSGLLHDIRATAKIIGEGNDAVCDDASYGNDATVNYYKRYANIDINPDSRLIHSPYYISSVNHAPPGWEPVPFDNKTLFLFHKP